MATPNPRRRQLSVVPPSFLSGPAFQKGATFHGPTSPKSQEVDPILNVLTLPQRSSTSIRDLETTLAAGQSHIADIFGAVERSFSSLDSFSNDSQATIIVEPEPVPRFMIDTFGQDESKDAIDIDVPYRKHHASDSGIGSTETSEASIINKRSSATPSHVQTGINGNRSTTPPLGSAVQHVLSEYACRKIQKHIIVPILREEKLKPFHSLVHGLPYRVARKEITCLRDLEKVILWLAPVSKIFTQMVDNVYRHRHGLEYLLSMFVGKDVVNHVGVFGVIWRSGLIFAIRNGQLLQSPSATFAKSRFSAFIQQSNISAAAILLDQPTDPILMDTSSISSNRSDNTQQSCQQKEQEHLLARAPTLQQSRLLKDTTMDHSNNDRNEKLTLVGGLSQTGRPAELVRTVDGKSVSLRTGEEVNMEDYKTGIKRSFGEELDDDLERSMARRKKNAIRVDQHCAECGKAFKRPCDLTKHEKTHSRPWKCDEPGCKYHVYGWPTEKERDRHMNDKHSAAPKMYRCSYSPCPYESKRESNCKQHMEKAHGYIYIRAKNNGKIRAPSTIGAPTTPVMSTPGSNAFSAPTPDFSDVHSMSGSLDDNTFDLTGMPTMKYMSEATNFGEIFGPAGNEFNFAEPPFMYSEAGPSVTHRPSYDSNAVTPSADEDSLLGTDFNWSNFNMDVDGFQPQVPTPALSHAPAFTSGAPSVNQSPPSACLSPHGQANPMLFSPHGFEDEGYQGAFYDSQPMHDFNLYSNPTSGTISPGVELFGELPSYEKNSQLGQQVPTNFFDEMM